jgi:hypothetical protein
MTRGGLTLLATIVLAIAVPVGANATYSLFDYDSAVDALVAVDPTIRPEANDPGRDFVVGGYHGIENNNDGISAHSDAWGSDPQGHASDTRPGFLPGMTPSTFQGRFRVTCLAVVGNEAALGLTPTDASSNDQPTEIVLAVRDNKVSGIPDEYAFYDLPAALCPTAIPDAVFPIQSGNILVHDAVPIP